MEAYCTSRRKRRTGVYLSITESYRNAGGVQCSRVAGSLAKSIEAILEFMREISRQAS